MVSATNLLLFFHAATALRMNRIKHDLNGQPRACRGETMVQEITGASFSSPLEAFANRPISELCADDLRKAFVRNTNQSLTMYKTNPQEVSKSSLADCQMAFVTINNTKYPGHAIRQRNIKDMLRLYPN